MEFGRKIRNIWKEKRFFVRLMLGFSALMLCLLLAWAALLNYLNRSTREEVLERATSLFYKNSAILQDELVSAYEQADELLNKVIKGNYVKPAGQLTVADYLRHPALIGDLNRSQVSNEIVRHVSLFADSDRVYTENGLADFQIYFGTSHFYEDYPPEYWENCSETAQRTHFLPPTKVSHQDGIEVVMPLVLAKELYGRQYIMVLDLSMNNVMQLLTRNNQESFLLYAIRCDTSFYNWEGELELPQEEKEALILERPESNRYLVLEQDSIFGISLDCIVDRARMTGFVSEKYQGMTVVFLLFVSGLYVMAVLISIRLYNPIDRLIAILTKQEYADLLPESAGAGYNSFYPGLLQTAAQIRKSGEVSHTALVEIKRQCEYMVLQTLLFTPYHNLVPEQAQNTEYLLDIDPAGAYRCIVADILLTDSFRSTLDESQLSALHEGLKKVFAYYFHSPYIFSRGQAGYVVLTESHGEEKEAYLHLLKELESIFLFDFSCCHLRFGIGNAVSGLNVVYQSFEAAETAAYSCDGGLHFAYAFSEELPASAKFDLAPLNSEKYRNAFVGGNGEYLKKDVKARLDAARKGCVPVQRQREALYDLYLLACDCIRELEIDGAEIEEENRIYFESMRYGSLDCIEGYIQAVFELCDRACSVRTKNETMLSERIQDIVLYIQEHFQEDIYLESIAAQFGLSPKYLSKMFKKETQKSINDTITQCRMKAAADLLTSTRLSVQKIGEQVGISSRTTFFRLFRNCYGVAPNEFRVKNTGTVEPEPEEEDGENEL